jgi:osmoprotectant transport system ATP-binding protein
MALDELKRKTIIMVTHDVQEAFELGDHICLMDKGRIVQSGTPAELLFKPTNDFVKGFLQEQRLQLEFKALRLNDIWDYLPPPPPKGGAFDLQDGISAEVNLWASLESFKFSKSESLTITNDLKKETKLAGFEQLMSAFYQYKKQQPHD